MEGAGIDLGGATLRLYGDRSALDRELAVLKRYTDALERQGIKVRFDADTGKVNREIDGVQNRLHGLNGILGQLNQAMRGDWDALAGGLGAAGAAGQAAAGGAGAASGALGGLVAGASKAIPVLGQLGLAAMGLNAIFQTVHGTINATIGSLERMAAQSGRFNAQVAQGGIFAARSYAVQGPDGDIIEGTANQMRALRPLITGEFKKIQAEVAQISGATAAQVYEGYNLILQYSDALGEAGNDLQNITKLSTRMAAAMNVLQIPGEQLRSEVSSLLSGNVQVYDRLGKELGYSSERIKRLQAEGKFYETLMKDLEKLYDGQKVLAESLANVKSNYQDVFEAIASQGNMALERNLSAANQSILNQLTQLSDSYVLVQKSSGEAFGPLIKMLGQTLAMLVPIGSILASTVSMAMSGLAPVTALLNVVLGPALEGLLGTLQFLAKVVEINASNFNRLMSPVTAFLDVMSGGATQSIRTFFGDLTAQLEKINEWSENILTKWVQLLRTMTEWSARNRAAGIVIRDSQTGQWRGLNQKEQQAYVADAVAGFDVRAGYDPEGNKLINRSFSPDTKAFKDELAAKFQANTYGGLDGGPSGKGLINAKALADIRARMWQNDITGLEAGLKLLQAQQRLMAAMTEATEGRRRLVMERANFAVNLAGSPEARLNAESAQRDLAARQEQERLQERRQQLGIEREIQARQAQIQETQARLQTSQMQILAFEARIARDKAQGAVNEAREKLALYRGEELASKRKELQGFEAELSLRNQALDEARRAVELSRANEGLAREVAGIEGQILGLKEDQLAVQLEQANLTREQQRQLEEIQRQEQELKREREAQRMEAEKQKAALDEQVRAEERQLDLLGEQNKLSKAAGELAKARADQEVRIAERQLSVAESMEAAGAPGASTRDILMAQIDALAAGEAGMTSVADATRRLYDAKEKQLQREQEIAREQQRLQHEREQSELRIARLRLLIQAQEVKATIAREQLALREAQLQTRRDNLSAQVASTLPGAGTAAGGLANVLPGTKGGPNWNEGFGWSARRGRNHNGQDLGLDVGDPIHSIASGVVEQLIPKFGQVGGAVVIKNDDGTADLYGHVDPEVTVGSRVRAGQKIATVTNDGQNTHLHHEFWNASGQRVDPASRLRASLAGGSAPAAPALPPPAGTATTGRGNNRQVAMDYLVQTLGLTPAQAAGVVGNLMQESTASINPRMRFGGSVGLPTGDGPYGAAQWRGSRLQDLIQFAGGPEQAGDLRTQLRFMVHELQGKEARALTSLRGAVSPEQAALVFERDFERANGSALAQRQAYARTALSEYRPGAAGAVATAGAAGPAVAPTTGIQMGQAAQQNIDINQRLLAGIEDLIQALEGTSQTLEQTQGLQRSTLATSQAGQMDQLQFERRRQEMINAILGGPKAQLYADLSDTLSGTFSGVFKGALQQLRQTGEVDLAAVMQDVMGSVADRLLGLLLDSMFAPLEQMMKDTIFKTLSGVDPKEVDAKIRAEEAARRQEGAAQQQGTAATKQDQAADKMNAAADKLLNGPQAATTASPTALEVVPYSASVAQAPGEALSGAWGQNFAFTGPITEGMAKFNDWSQALPSLNESTVDLTAAFKQGATTASSGMASFGQQMSGVLGAMAGLGMAFAGVQQISKGGAGNVISGIGGILAGVGGMFLSNPFGIFGARATGGQANAGQRLLVGENGPELFDPPSNGHIWSNSDLRSAMAGSGRGGSGGGAGIRLKMEFQTTRFMDRDWVDREQLEEAVDRAERRGAERGERAGAARAIDMLKQSPRIRREVGINSF